MRHSLTIERPLTFFDLETTSAVVETARIVEIAMIRLEPGASEEAQFSSRVNPGIPIPAESTAVHGITDADVADAPPFRDVARRVLDMVQGADLAGFNASGFDVPILDNELIRVGVAAGLDSVRPQGRVVVDAYELEMVLNPRTLGALYEKYEGRAMDDSHDALADVVGTLRVLGGQLVPTTSKALRRRNWLSSSAGLTWIRGGDSYAGTMARSSSASASTMGGRSAN